MNMTLLSVWSDRRHSHEMYIFTVQLHMIVILQGFLVLNISEGHPMQIPCGVRLAGKSGPAIGEQLKWAHNGKLLAKSEEIEQRPDGSLSVQGAELSQAGNYTCMVKNSAGNANATVRVNIGGQ